MLRVIAAPPADGPRRAGGIYYGWVLVLALGVTETVSYGVLSYSFPVFIAPMESELGWSRTAVTGAFSVAVLVAGVMAIPVGRWVDRGGVRAVMTGGSVMAAGALLGWSRISTLAGWYLVALAVGVAMAAVLYEPAFAVVASWFETRRGTALTLLTFLGGFASVIFVPLTTGLVGALGWREALVWLAGLLLILGAAPHALLVRARPGEHGLLPDGAGPRPPSAVAPARPLALVVRSRSFATLAAGFGIAALSSTAVAVHLIPLLLERGHHPAAAGAVMGVVGVMALPGRLILTPLGDRWPRASVTAAIFALQALGVGALLLTRSDAGVWLFVALFGAGFGAISPARAALVGDLYGRGEYATISGVLALVVAVARAAGPVGASLLHAGGRGYAPVLAVLAALPLLSAALVLTAGGGEREASLTLVGRRA